MCLKDAKMHNVGLNTSMETKIILEGWKSHDLSESMTWQIDRIAGPRPSKIDDHAKHYLFGVKQSTFLSSQIMFNFYILMSFRHRSILLRSNFTNEWSVSIEGEISHLNENFGLWENLLSRRIDEKWRGIWQSRFPNGTEFP
jgi:hypothetical protein